MTTLDQKLPMSQPSPTGRASRLAIVALVLLARAIAGPGIVGLFAPGAVSGACTLLGRVLSNVLDGAPSAMLKPEIAEVVLIVLALVGIRLAAAGEPR